MMSPLPIAAQIAVVALLAGAYALRARRLARDGQPVRRTTLICVAAGLVVLLAGMVALRAPGRELLFWHTLERLLVGDLACLLIAVGLTDAVLAPLARTPLRRLRALTPAPVATALWIANLLLWQWPSIFDATQRHDSLTLVMNVVSIAVGLNMWRALLSAFAAARPSVSHRGIACMLIGRLAAVALASVAVWSPDVYYPYFMRHDIASSVSPLADQEIAGALMLAEMALIAIGLLLWMFLSLGTQAPVSAAFPQAVETGEPAHPASALAVDAPRA